MKNVLIIIGKLIIGGAEKIGRDIGFYADKSKYNIHYLVFTDEIGSYEEELINADCRIHHMSPPSDGYLTYCRNIRSLLKNESIDIIHSHTMFSSGWVMMIGKSMGIRVRISHSHSIRGPEHRGTLKNLYESTMRRVICRYATHLVACGNTAGEWLYGEKCFKEKGILIYNGIGLQSYEYSEEKRNVIRKDLNLENDRVIGHVGHLATVKNQVFIIRLLPELMQICPNIKLLLLGSGNDREMLEAEAKKLDVFDRVIFTGNVSNVGDYMCAMDVMAFPSLYEGMPLTLIEAQTSGLPCIISDCIPKDIHLTDLIHPVALSDKDSWMNLLLNENRSNPEKYSGLMYDMGFDTYGMLQKIYRLYEEMN